MPYDFSQLKLRSLFPDPYELPRQFKRNQQSQMGQEIETQYPEFQPRTEASDAYMQAAQNMPVREEPGMLRKIAGVIASMGSNRPSGISHGSPIGFEYNPQVGMAASEETLYPEFSREMRDWSAQLDPLSRAATIEQQGNVNERILYDQNMDRRIAQQRADEIQRKNEEDLKFRREKEETDKTETARKTDLSEKVFALRELQAKKPNTEYKHDVASGNIFALDKDNPSAPPINTGLKHGDLSDIQKMQIGLTNALTRIDATQDRLDARTTSTQGSIDARSAATQKAITERSGAKSSPTAKTAEEKRILMEIYNTDDEARPYIVMLNGKPTGEIKPVGWTGNEEVRKRILDKLYSGPSQSTPKPADPLGIR